MPSRAGSSGARQRVHARRTALARDRQSIELPHPCALP
ncbi:hypothetical protein L810_6372 [Burkholderia sp. AU4i]|nr:hypothetical protein L810_6372 [Burkholderia sp. AU4i]